MASKDRAKIQAHIPTIPADKALARLKKLFAQTPDVRSGGFGSTISKTWRDEIKTVLGDFYGPASPRYEMFNRIAFGPTTYYPGQPQSEKERAFGVGVDRAEAFLKAKIDELEEETQAPDSVRVAPIFQAARDTRRVFLVHGHDNGMKETVARYVTKLGLTPIILHEMPNEGRTIIEKFEHHADVDCAIVLLTADDIGSSKTPQSKSEDRARQNVVFEMGFFIGKLGRKQTIALLQRGVSKPSDIDGVVYIPLDNEAWRMQLLGELKAAGMQVDANKAFS